MIVGPSTTCGKNEVGQATHWFTYFENLQEAETTTKNVNNFKHKEMFVKDPCVFPFFKKEIETS